MRTAPGRRRAHAAGRRAHRGVHGSSRVRSSASCFGTTAPFDAAKLAALYPSHRAFVAAYRKAPHDP
jgi:hypothetical protein